MQVLAGCVQAQCEQRTELNEEWVEAFDAVRDLVLVALCDPDCAFLACGVLQAFAFHSQLREDILRERNFAGVLRLLYPADGACTVLFRNRPLWCCLVRASCMKSKHLRGSSGTVSCLEAGASLSLFTCG